MSVYNRCRGWLDWLDGLETDQEGGRGAWWRRWIGHRVLDKALIGGADRVLDLGTGKGDLAFEAARMAPRARIVAVDASPECIEELGSKAEALGNDNVRGVVGRLEDLPFEPASFNVAISRSSLVYADCYSDAVLEVSRILTAGGRYSFFEPLLKEVEWKVDLGGETEDFASMERILIMKRGADREGLRAAVRKAGLAESGSLVVRFGLSYRGRAPDRIVREYLHDLPRELSALEILRESIPEGRVLEVAKSFAEAAARGDAMGVLPGMFFWGAKTE